MERSPRITKLDVPLSCRLVQSGRYLENRERYMAQSKLTKNGRIPELPSLEYAKTINRGDK